MDVPAQDDLHVGLAVLLPQLCESVLAYQVACAVAERIPRLGHRAVERDALPQLRLLPVQVALHVTNVCATIYPS